MTQIKDILLEYNSKRPDLIIPEYGRHVQKLIKHAQKIEDLEEKQNFVNEIVNLMHQMNPHTRNVEEYREKLWKHLFRIAKYDLEGIQPLIGEIPTTDDSKIKPERVPYPQTIRKYRHYGRNVQQMVEKAIGMEDPEIKDEYIQMIGYYMKLAYKNWNRDHYVNDEIIKEDLVAMSGGKLEIPESFSLDHIKYVANGPNNHHRSHRNKGGGKKRYKNKNFKKRGGSNRGR